MDLAGGQGRRPPPARRGNQPHRLHGGPFQQALLLCPPGEPLKRMEGLVDGGGSKAALLHQVLTIAQDIGVPELLGCEGVLRRALPPGDEPLDLLAVGAYGVGASSGSVESPTEASVPGRHDGAILSEPTPPELEAFSGRIRRGIEGGQGAQYRLSELLIHPLLHSSCPLPPTAREVALRE